VWTTRGSVIDASTAVTRGQALAVEQAVRVDLAELDAAPSSDDLAAMLRDHADEGLRYLGLIESHRIVASAGTPVGSGVTAPFAPNGKLDELGGRIRLEVRTGRRRQGARGRVVIELEAVQAQELRHSATLTLGIGALAAASLLGVAIVLIRREARRQAEARAREQERKLASLGEMSAVLAHEIRNPLASLKGNAQLLAAMLPAGEKPRAKAERVVDEAVRLEQLTNDLLGFVRTGAIARADVDAGALLREAASTIPGEIAVDVPAPIRWSLDAGRIREVVVNLLTNAVEAGPPVRASLFARGGKLVFEVADRGPGIPEDDRARIFEPFFTNKTQGTGLGLAVARRIVELHGGTITALGDPGGGALFRVEIPR
jgi:two-component system sensor histidine kinase HydH